MHGGVGWDVVGRRHRDGVWRVCAGCGAHQPKQLCGRHREGSECRGIGGIGGVSFAQAEEGTAIGEDDRLDGRLHLALENRGGPRMAHL